MSGVCFYLDAQGDAEQSGTLIVSTEADFLRHALGPTPLLVRGEHLGIWAQRFAEGRGIQVQHLVSPGTALRALLPGLDSESVSGALQQWPEIAHSLDLPTLASRLAGGLSFGEPQHAAWWLMARLEAQEHLQPFLALCGSQLAEKTVLPWQAAYSAAPNQIPNLLAGWLGLRGISQGDPIWPVPFPLPLHGPAQAWTRKEIWRGVADRGMEAFRQWQAQQASVEVLEMAAASVADWLDEHPEELDRAALRALRGYLPSERYQTLERGLPAILPNLPPEQPAAWKNWMLGEYLPYRNAAAADHSQLLPHLKLFAEQFLSAYSSALNGGVHADLLVWQRSTALKRSGRLTLVVICDGLSLPDLLTLQGHLAKQDTAQRLSDLGHEVAFPALPTITHQAKPALVCGVAPTLSDHGKPLGEISTKEEKVRAALQKGKANEMVFWNYTKTDKLYHDAETLDEARSRTDHELGYLAGRLLKLMLDAIPRDIPAQLVITTDHGRLLRESDRNVVPPLGFVPEGRSALGDWTEVPAKGFEMREQYVLLGRSRFGLSRDCAMMWTDQTFRNAAGAAGHEVCPHGGLSPEEVLIPWSVYARDLAFRLPTLEIVGRGESEQPGTITLRAINSNGLPLTVESVSGPLAALLGEWQAWQLPANDTAERQISVASWPKSAALPELTLRAAVQAGQGTAQGLDAEVHLTTDELYTPTGSILDDLL